ncbi:MAG: hypothetical protein KBT36_00085 [Kurthia sp.]|nr:hypothetical protein [Candidatus Kurthia equi]
MLMAMTQDNHLFQLNMDASKEQLRELRKKQRFFCPACKQELLLKIGEIIIPYFSHVRKNDACNLFSDHESPAHVKGKILLFDWFQKQNIPVLLEPYLPAIRQRPDLLIKQEEKYTAIEFQCSWINSEKMQERTKGYHEVELNVKWIPLAKTDFYLGMQTVKLSSFHLDFIDNQQIIALDPMQKKWQISEQILPLYGKKYIYFNEKVELNQLGFPFVLKKREVIEHKLYKIWMEEKKHYLVNRLRFNKKGITDVFFKACYENRLSVLELPNWIGMPCSQQMKNHPIEWQLLAVLLLKTVDLDDAYREFRKRYPKIKVQEGVFNRYLRFLKRENPQLVWRNLENNSISEEIYSQYLALKFDN